MSVGEPQPYNATWQAFQQQWLLDVYYSGDSSPGSGSCFTAPVGSAFDSSLMLRILPLGASIVYGYESSDGNGFREDLRQQLINNNASVNYVGEFQGGSMVDNDVEAVNGYRIDQAAVIAEHALPWLPNLVIIHVGTNDAGQNYAIDTAADRLGSLVDRILSAVPGTVVLVSTIIPNGNAATEANIEILNAGITVMVQERSAAGKFVYLADMHTGYITTADLNADGTHPTDGKFYHLLDAYSSVLMIQPDKCVEGYAKMANVWYEAIQEIYSLCWFTSPCFVAGLNDTVGAGVKTTTCEKVPGNAKGPVKIQQGSGYDDGNYV
jgi:lysophospholipase L1-like esterase